MIQSVFITGIKHCGKSTLGKLISSELNFNFFDLDGLIEDNRGVSCRELFRNFGRVEFQKEEFIALEKLLKSRDNFVLATGGGICDNIETFNVIKNSGITIYIDEEWEVLFSRIANGGIPPFLKSSNPKEEFHNLYIRRSNLYRDVADITIVANSRTPNEIMDELLIKLKEFKNVRK